MTIFKWIFVLMLLISSDIPASAQIYVQIEIFNQPKTIKYQPGQSITFQESSNPDEWQSEVIKDILVDESVLLFEHGFLSIDNITKVKRTNTAAKYGGKTLMTFGIAYLLFGVIIEVATPNEGLNATNISVGTGALATGYILNKTFGKKIYWMGKTARLRVIDLRFSVPE